MPTDKCLKFSATKGQTSLEYLITHAWMFLIIAVVLAALVLLGAFNPGAFVSDTCTLPAGFTCGSTVLSTNGILYVSIVQETTAPINIMAIGCNTNLTTLNMQPQSPPIHVDVGSSYSFTSLQCYSGSSQFSAPIRSVYRGYLVVNYTDTATGLPHTITGSVLLKVETS